MFKCPSTVLYCTDFIARTRTVIDTVRTCVMNRGKDGVLSAEERTDRQGYLASSEH
jgi:hypothetical protein